MKEAMSECGLDADLRKSLIKDRKDWEELRKSEYGWCVCHDLERQRGHQGKSYFLREVC